MLLRSSPSGGSLDGTRTPDRAARYVLGFSSSGSLAIALATLRASSLVRYSGIIGTPMVVLAVDIGDVVIVAVVDPIAPRRLRHFEFQWVRRSWRFGASNDGSAQSAIGLWLRTAREPNTPWNVPTFWRAFGSHLPYPRHR